MATTDPRIDAYIAAAQPFAQPILTHLRQLVHAACPGVEETWKWSFPNFVYNGSILCHMAAFKQHAVFGFWKAALMQDPEHILTLTDRESMGHLGKLESVKDLPKDAVLKKYIKEAMRLTDAGTKQPAKPKTTTTVKQELTVPPYFAKALDESNTAKAAFNAFSYSQRKEYIEWLEEAKTDATRSKRMVQAIEWIAEGKSRHWKYKNC